MSRLSTLALSALLCLVLSQTVRGDLNTQVSRNLRQGNQSAGNPNRSSSQEGSAGLKVARKANQTGRANDSLATKADFHEPLLLPRMSQARTPHTARKPGQVRAMRRHSARHSSPRQVGLAGSAAGTTAAAAVITPSSNASATRTAVGSGIAAMTMSLVGKHRTVAVGVVVIRRRAQLTPTR